MSKTNIGEQLVKAARQLGKAVDGLSFSPPITQVYNPLGYAWAPHEAYLRRYGAGKKRVLFMGMNPGPFGMAQTGVPFGEIGHVRDWMGIEGPVGKPPVEHPKRPVQGFQCKRSEVSGLRLWSFFQSEFGPPENFFADHFVVNYCPLAFFEESGRNRTPDKLPLRESAPLLEACDRHLERVIELLEPEWLIGVGKFAEERLKNLPGSERCRVGTVLHPSPANPHANRDWAGHAKRSLRALGAWPL